MFTPDTDTPLHQPPSQSSDKSAAKRNQTATSLDAKLQQKLEVLREEQNIVSTFASLSESLGYEEAKAFGEKNQSKVGQAKESLESYKRATLAKYPHLQEKLEDTEDKAMRAGAKQWTDANASASALYNAMWGLGTNEQEIFQKLSGKSPAEIKAINDAYFDRYGVSLQGRLEQELSGSDLSYANALMSADKTKIASAKLYWACRGTGTDEKLIKDVYAELSPDEIKAVEADFNSTYAKQYGASDINEVLKAELNNNELNEVNALRKGNKIQASAARLHSAMDGAGTDEQAIFAELEQLSTEDLAKVKQTYLISYQEKLADALSRELGGLDDVRATALLEGNRAKADAAALEKAMNGGWFFGAGTDENAIESILTDRSEEELLNLEQEYDATYGKKHNASLRQELSDELNNRDKIIALSLLEDGKLSDAERISKAICGAGTDEQLIRDTLKDKTTEEITSMVVEYREKFGAEMIDELLADLSGDEHFDAVQALHGKPENHHQMHARIQERYQYETSGVLSGLTNAFSKEDNVLERDFKRATDLYQETKDQQELSKSDSRRWTAAYDQTKADFDGYRTTRNQFTDVAVTTGTVTAATVTTIATFGAGAPLWVVAAGVGASSLTASALIKGGLKGDAYGWEEQLTDVATSTADGVSAFVGGSIGIKTAQTGLRTLAIQQIKRAGRELSEEAIQQTSKQLLNRTLVRAGLSATGNITDGLSSGAISGTANGLVTDGTWDDGINPGLERLVTMGLVSMATSVTASTSIGGALDVGGSYISKYVGAGLDEIPIESQVAKAAASDPTGSQFSNSTELKYLPISTDVIQSRPMGKAAPLVANVGESATVVVNSDLITPVDEIGMDNWSRRQGQQFQREILAATARQDIVTGEGLFKSGTHPLTSNSPLPVAKSLYALAERSPTIREFTSYFIAEKALAESNSLLSSAKSAVYAVMDMLPGLSKQKLFPNANIAPKPSDIDNLVGVVHPYFNKSYSNHEFSPIDVVIRSYEPELRSALRSAAGGYTGDPIALLKQIPLELEKRTGAQNAFLASVKIRGESLSDILTASRSMFLRDIGLHNMLEENLKKRLIAAAEGATQGTTPKVSIGVVGVGVNQQPLSIAAQAADILERLQLSGKVDVEIHVLSKDGAILQTLSDSQQSGSPYPFSYAPGAVHGELPSGTKLGTYFTSTERGVQPSPEITKMLRYHATDITDASTSPAGLQCDVVLCNNVLLYVPKDQRQSAINSLKALTKPEGTLTILGDYESRIRESIEEMLKNTLPAQ